MTRWVRSADSGIPITITQPDDLAYALLKDDFTTTPVTYRTGCYICEDPEFARMGLPLCRVCIRCGGHVAADDTVCDDCGYDSYEAWLARQLRPDERTRTAPHGDPFDV